MFAVNKLRDESKRMKQAERALRNAREDWRARRLRIA